MSVPENSLSDQERLIHALLAQAESNNRLANAVAQLAAAIADEGAADEVDGLGGTYLDGTPK
ncbi:hypothetical protein N5C43_10995 [Comamonas terrigena]|uniref:hypothetical protein n=1 Tax=Comamonas terrigena TaxID=32013 RepID=UPI002446A790|nr:hypothetical protein [Comamonas terrigena]MDH1291783.1 hypothetical protein [Comamonas terrigena]